MSREITITLSDKDFSELQEYAEEFKLNQQVPHWTIEDYARSLILCDLAKTAEHKAFMLKLEKDLEELDARKSQK